MKETDGNPVTTQSSVDNRGSEAQKTSVTNLSLPSLSEIEQAIKAAESPHQVYNTDADLVSESWPVSGNVRVATDMLQRIADCLRRGDALLTRADREAALSDQNLAHLAYQCQNIPKAEELMRSARALLQLEEIK